jgi:hypothetical protein
MGAHAPDDSGGGASSSGGGSSSSRSSGGGDAAPRPDAPAPSRHDARRKARRAARRQRRLCRAARKGRVSKLRKLLGRGADVSAPDKRGVPPLHHAARRAMPRRGRADAAAAAR